MSDALISRYEKPLVMITKMLIIDAKYYLIISGTPRTKDLNQKIKWKFQNGWIRRKQKALMYLKSYCLMSCLMMKSKMKHVFQGN